MLEPLLLLQSGLIATCKDWTNLAPKRFSLRTPSDSPTFVFNSIRYHPVASICSAPTLAVSWDLHMPSFGDSAFIFILALLLFGPKKLPELARQLGKLMAGFRPASNEFRLPLDEALPPP